ncbi:MAG: ECF-type sigma factor [Planctomycetota bacterium]
MSDFRTTLSHAASGNARAVDELIRELYDELRRLAQHMLEDERPGQDLQATALVHEVYVRLLGSDTTPTEDRRAFFCAAARAMRHILVDHARKRDAAKRGGGAWHRMTSAALERISAAPTTEFLDVDAALRRLEELDERQCRIVELRFLAGLTAEQTAELLGVTTRTVFREWRSAQAWLRMQLGEDFHGS